MGELKSTEGVVVPEPRSQDTLDAVKGPLQTEDVDAFFRGVKTKLRIPEAPKETAVKMASFRTEADEEQYANQRSLLSLITEKIQMQNYHTDAYEEQLAHNIAYRNLQIGDSFPGKTIGKNYVVNGIFKNNEGLAAYGLKSDGKDPPILLFQGTDVYNKAQIRLDTDPDIGAMAVGEVAMKHIGDWLEQNPGAILTGHSLGGAIAQQVAVRHPEGVRSVVTFCAPGVKFSTAAQFTEHAKKIAVRHYFTEGDPFDGFGDTHLEGKVYRLPNKGKMVEAHSVSALYDLGKKNLPALELPRQQKSFTEKLRTSSPVQKFAAQNLDNLSETSLKGKKSRVSDLHESNDGREWVELETRSSTQIKS